MKSSLSTMAVIASLAAAACGDAAEDQQPREIALGLTNNDVMGFETVSGWTTTAGRLSRQTQHVQGAASLGVSNLAGNARLTSAKLTTLSSLKPTLTLSILLPTSQPNPNWLGNLQLAVNAPSRGVYSAYIGQKQLTGMPVGSFQKLEFAVPAWVVTALGSGPYADLQFVLTLDFPSSGTYLLDNLTFASVAGSDRGTNSRKVHLVYLVPSDRAVQQAYVKNLESAARHLQAFFTQQLGRTFTLTDPAVTVLRSTHDSAWFAGAASFHWNAVGEVQALTGVDVFNDANDRWMAYVDVVNPCNNGTGTTGSVATFPAQDLRGLTQTTVNDACSGAVDTSPRCRWVGGLGHELGHSLGLPHPPECEDSNSATVCPDDALMWVGYTTYPDAIFTPSDKTTLNASPVLQPETILPTPPDCNVVTN